MRYYVWFHSYHYDEEDKYVEVSEETYTALKPMEADLSSGNWPAGFGAMYDDVRGLPDLDLRPSEIDKLPWDRVIEVAEC